MIERQRIKNQTDINEIFQYPENQIQEKLKMKSTATGFDMKVKQMMNFPDLVEIQNEIVQALTSDKDKAGIQIYNSDTYNDFGTINIFLI